jgi:lipopolysaccharide export system protein LptC
MERRTLLVIIALAAISLIAWVDVWLIHARDDSNKFVGPPRSDYTLRNFTLDALDQEGAFAFSVVAPRMARRGDDGSIYVTLPNYELIDNSSNVWKGTSDSAWVDKDGDIMKLEGPVAMHRVPTEKVDRIDLLTTDLTITTDPKPKDAQGHNINNGPPRDKRMTTSALTTIIEAGNVTHGIGMKADSDLKTMELLSDVHTISLPKEKQ